jgi:hypothetical protein
VSCVIARNEAGGRGNPQVKRNKSAINKEISPIVEMTAFCYELLKK